MRGSTPGFQKWGAGQDPPDPPVGDAPGHTHNIGKQLRKLYGANDAAYHGDKVDAAITRKDVREVIID